MIRILLALAVVAVALPARAQTPAPDASEAEVLAVVQVLFEGMREGDTTAMRATLHPDVRLVTTGGGGAAVVPVEAWLEAVAGSDQVLDERLYDPEVRVSGPLAAVWTFYTLHVDDTFSHCGYDAFQLVRSDDGWRIIAIADTRRREPCNVPGPGSAAGAAGSR